jgi:hypothetical protein
VHSTDPSIRGCRISRHATTKLHRALSSERMHTYSKNNTGG